jgi:hypothetical protein
MTKRKLYAENRYSFDEFKRLVLEELTSRGYDSETIDAWVPFIEDD